MFGGALMKKVLIIEDDKNINEMLQELLSNNGYNVSTAYSGTEALLIHNKQIDLIILDLMLPGKNGEEIIKKLKTINDVPIIITTAINDIDKKLDLFELGADDYITKPFKPSLLYAKCLALLKRNKKIETNQLQSGKVILDLDKHILVIEENNIVLTDKEFKLIRYLMENQGIVLSREKILDALWGYDYYGDGRAVDTYIKRLRKRLGKYSYYIQTIVKTGYVWKGEEL